MNDRLIGNYTLRTIFVNLANSNMDGKHLVFDSNEVAKLLRQVKKEKAAMYELTLSPFQLYKIDDYA